MRTMKVLLVLGFMLPVASNSAESNVESVTVNGSTVFVTSTIPAEFIGLYKYEKKGEPVIELKSDRTGLFQPHMRPPIPITYWLKTDADGNVEKTENPNTGSYRVTVVLKYGQSTDGNYPTGGYDMWYLTWDAGAHCFNILGERFKC